MQDKIQQNRRDFMINSGKVALAGVAVSAFAGVSPLIGANSGATNPANSPKILIIGANGSVARVVTQDLLDNSKVNLRLYLRNAKRLASVARQNPQRIELFEGNALNKNALKKAMNGVDVVYANLSGSDIAQMAQTITQAMHEAGLKRLVWISARGVYQNEYAELANRPVGVLPPLSVNHAQAVRVVEKSGLDYTIIRAPHFTNADEIDYTLTRKGESFAKEPAEISRKSIAHLVRRLCLKQDFGIGESFGISKK